MTACNPDGVAVNDGENTHLSAELAAILQTALLPHFLVVGGSPDFTHVEPGFGIRADLATCLKLGRDFRQEAIFWINHDDCLLVDCLTE